MSGEGEETRVDLTWDRPFDKMPWHIRITDADGGIHMANLREQALIAEVERLRAQVADLTENPRDEHHTMRELYDYRMLYNAHAAHGWHAAGIPVVKSWHHSDGEECFGGGWFIVTATLPTGQVSNHYKAEFWELFDVPEVDLPPEYDGHTPLLAAARLGAMLYGPQPEDYTLGASEEPTASREESP